MPKISRRQFIKLGAGTAAFLSAPHLISACNKKQTTSPESKITAQVAAVRGDDLYEMTHDVLDALGGIQKIVHIGETVFIKPNMVTLPFGQSTNRFTNGECTKPEIVVAVTEECLQAGASEVIIGDGSQMPSFDWQYALTLDGSTNLVNEVQRLNSQYQGKVTLACLEVDSPRWIEVPSRTYLDKIAVSSLVTDADRVISIAVAKTHSWAQLTLSLKNFVGVTSLERYAVWMESGYWDRGGVFDHSTPQAIAQIYLDVVDAIKPDLAIIDFSIGVEANGPTVGQGMGRTVDTKYFLGNWLILASTDLVAADTTAARVMNHNVNKIKQLELGFQMGLGEIRHESIEMIGENLEDLRMAWIPATLRGTTS